MPIEAFGNIDDLDPANPLVDDPVSEGDDHIRGIKESLQGNVTGDAIETRLMVDAVIRAFVDANRFTAIDELLVKGALVDVDNSALATDAIVRFRNAVGGWDLNAKGGNGSLELDQVDAAGLFEAIAITIARGGGVTLRHNDEEAISTADGALDNSKGIVRDFIGTSRPIGFNSLPQATPAGDFTLAAVDNGTRIRTGNTGVTITIPSANVPSGFTVILQKGTVTGVATDTIVTTGTLRWYKGDEILTGNRLLRQGGICTIARNATNVYDIWGTGLT